MKEPGRWYAERILVKDAANDDHRMRLRQISHSVRAGLCEAIRSDDCIIVLTPHIFNACFEFGEILGICSIFRRSFQVADDPPTGKPVFIAARRLFEHVQQPVLIEKPISKICFSGRPQLELPAVLCARRVNPRRSKASQVDIVLNGTKDVNRLVVTFGFLLNEGKQYAMRFVIAVEERVDMACLAEFGASYANGYSGPLHDYAPSLQIS
jgi:hypothetical protein